jgi:hypothetical protein
MLSFDRPQNGVVGSQVPVCGRIVGGSRQSRRNLIYPAGWYGQVGIASPILRRGAAAFKSAFRSLFEEDHCAGPGDDDQIPLMRIRHHCPQSC